MTKSAHVLRGKGLDLDEQVYDWLASAPPEYKACRDTGHAWPRDKNFIGAFEDGRQIEKRVLHCVCGVVRTERIDPAAGTYTMRHKYPRLEGQSRSDYLLPPGAKLSRLEVKQYGILSRPDTAKPKKSRTRATTKGK